jgi:transposase
MAKFLRKKAVAARYGDVSIRTIERMVDDGRLPPPTYRGRIPLWDEAKLDESDRAATSSPDKAA